MLKVRPLAAPYALATGAAILDRIAAYGAMPPAIAQEFQLWKTKQWELAEVAAASVDIRELDSALDRAVELPHFICRAIIEAYEDSATQLDEIQVQRLADARTVLPLFGDDLRALIHVPYTEEWTQVGELLQKMSTDLPKLSAIRRLGLSPDFDHISKLHELYGEALGLSQLDSAPDAAKRLASWNAYFSEFLVAARYLDRKYPGLFAIVGDPYQEQLRRQLAAMSGT